ncbi:guanyl-nucleotide exchange factor [Akanthomyces lecanii RCEF 1005]|uniref:Guanyl-nucleotide exchange factor n=1 Tax=Akanthomyces lecanii RCEF 1005 TaxID=1081108 RepID=A0A162KNB3_CORDF|nr:guanyl-nucleotide exchange factor [Akanthomyces lecanii RCEF 1005]
MPFLRRRGNLASDSDTRQQDPISRSGKDAEMSTAAARSDGKATDLNDQAAATTPRDSTTSRPDTSHNHDDLSRQKRFSVLRFRNASDSQLSLKAKQQAEQLPPLPSTPAIITTAPTNDFNGPRKVKSRMSLAAARFRRSNDIPRDSDQQSRPKSQKQAGKSFNDVRGRPTTATIDEPQSPPLESRTSTASNGTSLTTPAYRQSESSRSDASSTDNAFLSSPNTTPKKTPASSIFRLKRMRKTPDSLFPLAHLPQKSKGGVVAQSASSLNVAATPRPASSQSATTPKANLDGTDSRQGSQTSTIAALQTAAGRSGQSSPTRTSVLRGRSSTMSSLGRNSTDDHLTLPQAGTSTGRKSFGDLLGISRLRQNSDLARQGTLTPLTPGSVPSNHNSFQLSRETVILPDRKNDESATKYLERLEADVPRGILAASLAKSTDLFLSTVLRSYMRRFSFFGDPMDMALRKLLMQAELPKETQQIDRFLQAFANRYHECNPGIYSSPDQAYFIAFSLLILHTDVFNKNNKHKMQKSDYIKNTRGEGIFDDILECFYDNISYTPFIHVEDDLDLGTERNATIKSKRKPLIPGPGGDTAVRAAKEPIDPYTLIFEGNLDLLRPNWKDAMCLEDHFNYLGTATSLNMNDLQKTFFRTGVLQIISPRSRPDAFMSEKTATNPQEAQQGIVDIKITKVGLLWRKDAKRRKTRSPWQEWGAILTGAQLYFFRNTSWVKGLMHQYENHIKAGHDEVPIIFNPPLSEFKPDVLMSTHGAVALLDTTYKKHKNAFIYVRQEGLDEVLLADNEDELNDWLAKLNYAAAFRTSGVKMRGIVGGNYDGQGRRGMRRLDSSDGIQLVQTPTGPVTIARGKIDHKMAEDIQIARRRYMQVQIAESDQKVEEAQKQLEEQLRNARHLQILAPIQPRTRDSLLSAAARMSAQLKWTRMRIWKETCHRDILLQDFNEELPASPALSTPNNKQDLEQAGSPTPKPPVVRTESKDNKHTTNENGPVTPTEPSITQFSNPQGTPKDGEASQENEVDAVSFTSAASPIRTPVSSPRPKWTRPQSEQESVRRKSTDLDEMDAEEQDLLRQAGLLERRRSKAADKANTALTDSTDALAERDRLERTKVRRSLQRTLRESAGHLSHHRSKRGREPDSTRAEDTGRESILSRGAGSFVVHGKKASVITLGTEIQNMSNDDKIVALKLQHQGDQPPSPSLSYGGDEDFHSAIDASSEGAESRGRRESAASTNTATALSFRELHRKYSSAQAARIVSAGGRLAIPSDGESEVAVSFSDGRRSSLPPIETESEEEDFEVNTKGKSVTEAAHDPKFENSLDSDRAGEEAEEKDAVDSSQDLAKLASRALQVAEA